ncbi:hypothetical protein Y1Q_0021636 [Alligator mississippiensis]|uniref:Uncharacterized protein n=1 Tax=Alligator mississippiensis TaxID=8496 RepID=A0A151PAE2_ALLMI|nr:hypothetical protein Y1Q_0021636 [Alligator mississippiensis]
MKDVTKMSSSGYEECSLSDFSAPFFRFGRKSSLVILHHADHSQLPLTSVGVLEIVSTSQKCLQLQLARLAGDCGITPESLCAFLKMFLRVIYIKVKKVCRNAHASTSSS